MNYILGAQHGLRIACVINDMSEVNIDAALIAQGSAALSRVENKLVCVIAVWIYICVCVCSGTAGCCNRQRSDVWMVTRDIDHEVAKSMRVCCTASLVVDVTDPCCLSLLTLDALYGGICNSLLVRSHMQPLLCVYSTGAGGAVKRLHLLHAA